MGFAVDNVLLFFLLKSTHDVLSVRDCSKLAFSNVVVRSEGRRGFYHPVVSALVSPDPQDVAFNCASLQPLPSWILPFSYLESQRELELEVLLLHVGWSRLFPFTQVP